MLYFHQESDYDSLHRRRNFINTESPLVKSPAAASSEAGVENGGGEPEDDTVTLADKGDLASTGETGETAVEVEHAVEEKQVPVPQPSMDIGEGL